MTRARPNILVLGTPGTGKSTICQQLCDKTGLTNITLSDVIKAEKLYSEWDDEYNAAIFDEDKVFDWLDSALSNGGMVVEFHSCDWMEPTWFDLIVILKTDTNVLYSRLEKRGYTKSKVEENVQAEIFMVCREEAFQLLEEVNGHSCILELENNQIEQVDSNVEAISQCLATKGFCW